ncbi:MAG TPA: NYN domain-containing protein [Candidatus Saccharimonadales bacterium]|nr:NYN domain-containing protein [Candidatus Saccharimonadales bacterium]
MADKGKKKKRVAIFIDGSNFYFKLKTLVPTKTDFIHYRYRELLKSLLDADEAITYIGYYVGVVRDTKKAKNHEKALELIKNQQKVFEQLKHQRIEVVKGYLLERDNKFFEKGVDVRLAIDIVSMAFEKQYDVAVVVSSDTDLIPAIVKAKQYKKDVVYVGFEHQPSLALLRYATRFRVITRKEAERYAAKTITVRRYDEN